MSNTDRGVNPLYRPRSSGWVTGSVETTDNVPDGRLLYTYNKDLGLLHLGKYNYRSYINIPNEQDNAPAVIAVLPQDVVGDEEVIVPVGVLAFTQELDIVGVALHIRPTGDVCVDTNWTGTRPNTIAIVINLTIPMAGFGNGWPEASTT